MPFLGGYRFISCSFLGVFLFGAVTWYLFQLMGTIVLVDMGVVWTAFMVGFISHLLIDTLTKEGVAWLFPLPLHFGFPPLKALRLKTSGVVEKSVIFPGLMFVNVWIYSAHYKVFLTLFKSLVP